jgi:hypothetical protein
MRTFAIALMAINLVMCFWLAKISIDIHGERGTFVDFLYTHRVAFSTALVLLLTEAVILVIHRPRNQPDRPRNSEEA